MLDKIPLVSVANLSKGWSCFVHLHFNPEVSEKVVHTGSKAHFIIVIECLDHIFSYVYWAEQLFKLLS